MVKKPVAATSVEDYIQQISEPRQSEIKRLHAAIRKAVPKLKPSIQYGMIGYGTYLQKYANGNEAEAPIIAMASQKAYISVYVPAAERSRKLLPKASIGKSCIRFKKFDDIDIPMLTKVIEDGARLRSQGTLAKG
jgi:hypothetical protein